MANTKKELISATQDLVVDIFDLYEKYSAEDQKKIEDLLTTMKELNSHLKGYEVEEAKKPKWLLKLEKAFNDYFGKKK